MKATQVTGVLYAAHLIAEAGGFFKKESVDVELLASPAGARSAQMLAAGQVHFVLGDTSHAQRLTEQGKPTVRPLRHGSEVPLREHHGAQGAL